MAQKDARSIQAELAKPFAAEDLEWRLQKAVEAQKRGIAVPFVTNRAIQNRLDDVVAPEKKKPKFAASRFILRAKALSQNGTARRIQTLSPSRAASATA